MTPPTVPTHVKTRQEFLDLRLLYKQKLALHLPPLSVSQTLVTRTVTNGPSLPRVEVIHAFKKPAGAITPSRADTVEDTTGDYMVYSLVQLWTAVAKQLASQRFANPSLGAKLRWMGRRIKMTLKRENSPLVVIVPEGRVSIRATEEISQWVTIDKAVMDSLTREEQEEWSVLCAIIVATRGGKRLRIPSETQSAGDPMGKAGKGGNVDGVDSKSIAISSQSSLIDHGSNEADEYSSSESYYSTDEEEQEAGEIHNLASSLQSTALGPPPPPRRQPDLQGYPTLIPGPQEHQKLQLRFETSARSNPKSNSASAPSLRIPIRPDSEYLNPYIERPDTSKTQQAPLAVSKTQKAPLAALDPIIPLPGATRSTGDLEVQRPVQSQDYVQSVHGITARALTHPPPQASNSSSDTDRHLPFNVHAGTTSSDIIREATRRGRGFSRNEVNVETQQTRPKKVYTTGPNVRALPTAETAETRRYREVEEATSD